MGRIIFFACLFFAVPCWGQTTWDVFAVGENITTIAPDIFTSNWDVDTNPLTDGWTSETDTGSLLDVSTAQYTTSPNSMHCAHSAVTNSNVLKTLASSYRELWVSYDIKFDEVTGWGASTKFQSLNILSGAQLEYVVRFWSGAGGETSGIDAQYYSDTPAYTTIAQQPITAVADTWYNVIVHVVSETAASTNDGILQVWFGGSLIIDAADLNNYTYGNVNGPKLGKPYSELTTTTLDIYYDNFRVRPDGNF